MEKQDRTIWIIGGLCIIGTLFAIVRYSFASYFIPQISSTTVVQNSSKTIKPTPHAMPTKIYSLQDISSHNSSDSCWVVVNKYVYDISAILKQYSSSTTQNVQICGTDQSTTFSKMLGQNGLNASQLISFLAQYAIGKVE